MHKKKKKNCEFIYLSTLEVKLYVLLIYKFFIPK